jgi:histidinol-phosphate aminotransferase
VYYHFVDRRDYTRASTLIGEGKNVIGLHSFSKAYGLAALRLGYLFSTPDISHYLRHFRRPFMVSALAMVAGMAALDDYEHITRTVRATALEKRWLCAEFRRCGIMYWPSDANFILIRPPVNSLRFCQHLLQNGIMVRSTEPLGAPGLVRITIGNREMNEALIRTVYNLQYSKIG